MKTLFAAALLAISSLSSLAQSIIVTNIAANTAVNLLSTRASIESGQWSNLSTTAVATVKFYDSATSSTNVTKAGFMGPGTPYQTNYSVTYTNSAGIVDTNSFTGWYVPIVTNAPSTVQQTILRQFTIPINATRELSFPAQVGRGLTVLSDQAGLVELSYRLGQ